MKTRYIILLLAAILAGCGSSLSGNCSHQIEDLQNEFGAPQDIDTFDAGAFHRYTYWYWRLGFARTFTWDGSTGSCETADQNFPPSEQRPATNPAPGA